MEDELLQETLDSLESRAVARLRAADVNDTKTLQTLVMSLQACSGLRRQIELVAQDGIAAFEKSEAEANLSPFRRQIKKINPFT